ncbi:MAG: K(+)-transporting ATPase subunit F [Gammaproteobacteria bacterium]
MIWTFSTLSVSTLAVLLLGYLVYALIKAEDL